MSTELLSTSEQPRTSTLMRPVSSRIAAIQKSIVIPKNKIDIETKPLPTIPNPKPSTSNNIQVYKDDENIYEELNPSNEDYDYFTDSDFDTTDEEDEEEATQSVRNKLNSYYECGDAVDGKDDPRKMLQKVLLIGVQKDRINNREVVKQDPTEGDRYDIPASESAESVDVAGLLIQLRTLERKVEELKKNNELLISQNNRLQEENAKLRRNITTSGTSQSKNTLPILDMKNSNSRQIIAQLERTTYENNQPFRLDYEQRKNVKETLRFFESIQR